MADAIVAARAAARRSERAAVVAEIAGLVERSGLGRVEFARPRRHVRVAALDLALA